MKFTKQAGALSLTAAAALVIVACGGSSSGSASTINGSGSTFAAPIYQQWGATTKTDDSLTVNYQGVGSGQGISELTSGTVDFAGSDPPMTAEEMVAASKKSVPLHFPTALGAITISYNVSGVATGLKLDGATLAQIFLGKVSTWNDPAIAAQNPGVTLPSNPITVVHRSDSSGTTKGFTGYLTAVDSNWSSQVGKGKTVKWPTGTGAKGNDGVAAAVKQTPNSVGYVEQAYALQNKFTFASVKNAAGTYVEPTLASTTAAAEGTTVPADLRFTISNPSNPAAYPITSQTFVVAYTDACKAGYTEQVAKGIKTFLTYGLGAGQDALAQLNYAKLPADINSKATAQLSKLVCNGKAL
ncbi:MAG: phosphate ABC transporter substrate-binding protein PstS [Solirubrobacterales bacterium]|nr:phosphate ABC transporter substrate-binding protein PstS [Solirubrobacterales bacterium]